MQQPQGSFPRTPGSPGTAHLLALRLDCCPVHTQGVRAGRAVCIGDDNGARHELGCGDAPHAGRRPKDRQPKLPHLRIVEAVRVELRIGARLQVGLAADEGPHVRAGPHHSGPCTERPGVGEEGRARALVRQPVADKAAGGAAELVVAIDKPGHETRACRHERRHSSRQGFVQQPLSVCMRVWWVIGCIGLPRDAAVAQKRRCTSDSKATPTSVLHTAVL